MTSTITNGIDYTFISFEILTFYSNYDLAYRYDCYLAFRLSRYGRSFALHIWTYVQI